MVLYQFRVNGLYPVDAQTAGEELSRIWDKNGSLTAADVVEESRDEFAPLHNCFLWNDAIAAEKYRVNQAEDLIRCVTVVSEVEKTQEPVRVRAFVSTDRDYQPIAVVLQNEDMREKMFRDAIRDMNAFRHKYENLKELAPVFDAIEAVVSVVEVEGVKCTC